MDNKEEEVKTPKLTLIENTRNPFYFKPKINSNLINSNSTSKRNSIQALNSISHLQHIYSKLSLLNNNNNSSNSLIEEPEEIENKENELNGSSIENDNNRMKLKKGNRHLKINLLKEGGGGGPRNLSYLDLPPSPLIPNNKRILPWEVLELNQSKIKFSKKELKEQVLESISNLCLIWGLPNDFQTTGRLTHLNRNSGSNTSSNYSESTSMSTDNSISSNTTLVEPEEMLVGGDKNSDSFLSNLIESTIKSIRIIQNYSITLHSTTTFTSSSNSINDNTILRKSSFLVLSTLAELKDLYRLPSTSSSSSSSSISIKSSSKDIYDFDESIEIEGQEVEEEIINYRPDISLKDLNSQIEIIKEYIEVVNKILFQNDLNNNNNNNISSKRRIRSEISENIFEEMSEEEQEENLPLWIKKDNFGSELEQLYEILITHLEEPLSKFRIVSPLISNSKFFNSLSDGELLCHTFNSILNFSLKPFGFIPKVKIHSIYQSFTSDNSAVGVEEKGEEEEEEEGKNKKKEKVGTTFRKIENLNLFVSAIKFRYLIQINHGDFEPKLIARKELGWEKMLMKVIRPWMEVIIQEKREEIDSC